MTETIPLVTVAAELGIDVDQLAARCDGAILTDPDTGLRTITAATCKTLIDERAAQQAAQAAQAEQHRARLAAMGNPTHQRVAALQARTAEMRAAGLWDASLSAHDVMLGDDAESSLARAGRKRDALFDAERHGYAGVGAMFNPPQKG